MSVPDDEGRGEAIGMSSCLPLAVPELLEVLSNSGLTDLLARRSLGSCQWNHAHAVRPGFACCCVQAASIGSRSKSVPHEQQMTELCLHLNPCFLARNCFLLGLPRQHSNLLHGVQGMKWLQLEEHSSEHFLFLAHLNSVSMT